MAIRQDLTVNQGETWTYTYTHKDSAGAAIDLTAFTARMMVKASFADGFKAYLSTGADANGGQIVLGGVAGTVTLSMTADETARIDGNIVFSGFETSDLSMQPARSQLIEPALYLLYDLELISGAGAVTRALQGRFILNREITK